MEPFYQDEKVRLYQADVLAWALDYKARIDRGEALPFHCIFADPPYSLGETPPIEKLLMAWLNDKDIQLGKGFMGAIWDVTPSPKYWRAMHDITYPGGYMFLFSGTRTADLLGISCRLGGWEPFDRVTNFMYCYGAGFPKSTSISKQIDKQEWNMWHDISKALDGVDIYAIIELWKKYLSNAQSVIPQSASRREKVGPNMQRESFALTPVLLPINQGKSNALAIIAELNSIVVHPTIEGSTLFARKNAAVTTIQLSAPAIFVESLLKKEKASYSIGELESNTEDFIAQCVARALQNEKTTGKLKAAEALKTWLGSKKSSSEAATNALCAALTDDLRHIILSQSKTFQSLDTTSQMGFVSAMTVTIMESTAALLITYTANTLKKYALEQAALAKREVVGESPYNARRPNEGVTGNTTYSQGGYKSYITAPATPLAQAFDDYGSALKPAGEPVLLFRRPREGRTFAQCAREFGSGGLNVGQTRVRTSDNLDGGRYSDNKKGDDGATYGSGINLRSANDYEQPSGRFPPNTHFTHSPPTHLCPACTGDGCDECHQVGMVGGCVRVGTRLVKTGTAVHRHGTTGTWGTYGTFEPGADDAGYADPDGREEVADWRCVEGCAIRLLDEQAGERRSACLVNRTTGQTKGNATWNLGTTSAETGVNAYNDKGSASRFYPNHDWSREIAERLAGATQFRYCAKASSSERNFGLAQHLPRTKDGRKRRHQDLDGSWLKRAVCRHPTVKPLSLLIWLCALAKPPDIFKPRICIPFAGVMSEGIAAALAGWNEIHAIELERIHCEWGLARWKGMDKWAKLTGKSDPAQIRKLGEAAEASKPPGQVTMFDLLKRGLE